MLPSTADPSGGGAERTAHVCGHHGCSCPALANGYCSEFCASHAADAELGGGTVHRCRCGHPDCAGA